jgi:YetA-like protein
MNEAAKTLLLGVALVLTSRTAAAGDIAVDWLDRGAPPVPVGVSFGVPWARGTVQKTQTFALRAGDGAALPLQSWPLAFWPDGSIKWTGFATVGGPSASGPLRLSTEAAVPRDAAGARVLTNEATIEVDTGRLHCRIPKRGGALFDTLEVDGRVVARQGRLVCILQDGPDGGPADSPARTRFFGRTENVTVEQSGPVRVVVKIEGRHWAESGSRGWLPFVVRLYFFAGQDSVRLVHTIIYDGDQEHDFIRGLGLSVKVPMREEVQNRHVAFSGGGDGLWAEPVQPLVGRQGRYVAHPKAEGDGSKPRDVYPEQIAGKRVPNRDQVSPHARELMAQWAVWDSFKLMQPNADGFTVLKRTNPQSSWLPAGAGQRASGFVFAGDVTGGLGISIRNFWQSYPASLEVDGASTPEAEVLAWLWSPDAASMDMRHYDTRAHGLEAAYEDVQPGLSTATGVARTSEMTLFASARVPTKQELSEDAHVGQSPPLLVSSPEYVHSTGVFGIWGLPDRSTPYKRFLEDQADKVISVYEKEVEQRHWYGFWTYGNVMHSYDETRHVWRYDLGGMAWDNTELATDMWLWYSYLRTGRSDIFRLAEAMARNTSETDIYHLGRFSGLGSRHNVVPWGDGAKEARISQAAFRRFYYYLTTDERIGDVMREVVNVDYKVAEVDPMREAQPENDRERQYPARVRLGPDWFAFAGNWMTEWERTGDAKWRDKIVAGLDSVAHMPLGMRSGRNLVFGYDPATGRLYPVSDELGDYNLATIQGGAEVVFELNGLIDRPDWMKTWLQYCRLRQAPVAVIRKDLSSGSEGSDGAFAGPGRLAAYAYLQTRNPAFAKAAALSLFGGLHGMERGIYQTRRVEGPEVLNPIDETIVGTNTAAQSGLTVIEVLAMCGDVLPTEVPEQTKPDYVDPPAQKP